MSYIKWMHVKNKCILLSPHADRHAGNTSVTVCFSVCLQDFW